MTLGKNKSLSSFDALRFLISYIDAFTILDVLEENIDIPTISEPTKDEVRRNEDILRIPAC